MIGRFFDGGLPKNDTAHSETVWLNLLALYILDMEFSEKQSQWVLIAQKAKTFLKDEGVNPTHELSNLFIELVESD